MWPSMVFTKQESDAQDLMGAKLTYAAVLSVVPCFNLFLVRAVSRLTEVGFSVLPCIPSNTINWH